ncbi:MAG: 4a-hydroxytetrahydrobiopterin dehydratase [Chloroflexi bacterium]|nr:4a-hydroxytetrahydrobiopterin dehydratase [Chloroflexota bacterium]
MALLADEDIQASLAQRTGWSHDNGALVKKFELADFMAVVNLVNAVAPAAEAADHHPDMFINYRRITFTLSTHSEGGVTEKDFALLDEIEQLAGV